MTNQNDFVIDNGTGLAVRQDIQDALQALAGLSSGDSAPSTTYAFQLYANTTSGMLQIRNAANSAFIDLIQLDGTFTLEDGSASTPALAFRDDLNTGIFSSAADTFNVATAGVERMELGTTTIFNESGADVDFRIESDDNANMFFLDANVNRIGIGTSSPEANIHVFTDSNGEGVLLKSTGNTSNALTFDANRGTEAVIAAIYGRWNGTTVAQINFVTGADGTNKDDGFITFGTESAASSGNVNADEKMRLDSSGRLLIGSTVTPAESNTRLKVHCPISSSSATAIEISQNTNGANKAAAGLGIAIANGGESTNAADLKFSTATGGSLSTKMTLGSSGHVNFQCSDTSLASQTLKKSDAGADSIDYLQCRSNGNSLMMKVGGNGGISNFQSNDANLSDQTMKKNIVDCESIIEKFKQWKLRKFNYNSDVDGTPLTYGLIAQEIETVHSDLVNEDFPTEDEEGNEVMKKSVKDHQLMMLGFKALQEAIAKIESLETKVAALETA
tara:strand:+ start:798 stop:2306 length:1509 start_codon:yes stop_codon:yes gene_type:complete